VVSWLVEGELPVSALAEPFDMALPSFAQHLKVLEDCGLIASEKRGPSRWCRLVQARFDERRTGWKDRRRWAERLDRLEVYLDKTGEDDEGHGKPD
jgi:DNA-binding transcriptional ArsR family regulator